MRENDNPGHSRRTYEGPQMSPDRRGQQLPSAIREKKKSGVRDTVSGLFERFRLWRSHFFGSREDFLKREEESREQLGHNPQSLLAKALAERMMQQKMEGKSPERRTDVSPLVHEAAEELMAQVEALQQAGMPTEKVPMTPLMQELARQDIQNQQVQQFLEELAEEAAAQQEQEQQAGAASGSGSHGEGGSSSGNGSDAWLDKFLSDSFDLSGDAASETGSRMQDVAQHLTEDTKGELDQSLANGTPVPLDSLSAELQEQLHEYIENLSDEDKRELRSKALHSLRKFEQAITERLQEEEAREAEEHQGNDGAEGDSASALDKFKENMARKKAERAYRQNLKDLNAPVSESAERRSGWKERLFGKNDGSASGTNDAAIPENDNDYEDFEELEQDYDHYREARNDVRRVITTLEQKWRDIFVRRRSSAYESGHTRGKRMNVEHRIREKAERIPAARSRSWEQLTRPEEKDYATKILVDLTGSVKGEPLEQILRSMISILEPMHRLDLVTSVDGFNDRMYPYKGFNQPLSSEVRSTLGGMQEEFERRAPLGTDLGWAIKESATDLMKRKEKVKTLIYISDGVEYISSKHQQPENRLPAVMKMLGEESDIRVIPIIIGGEVNVYSKNAVYINSAQELRDKLPEVMDKVISE